MKKNLFMLIASGMLVFGTASAATNARPASDAEQSGVSSAPMEKQRPNYQDCQNRRAECRPDGQMRSMMPRIERHQHHRLEMMQEKLGLSKQQSTEIQQLMQKQFRLASKGHQELMGLNHKLQAESLKAHPDKKVINTLSEEIGKEHAALARLKSNHLAEVASRLTPEQRSTMLSLMSSRPMRGGYDKPMPE